MSILDTLQKLQDAALNNIQITRSNVDRLIDSGQIECQARDGRWYDIRRNGQTQRWKRDSNRIYLPFKMGFRTCGQITERDFLPDGRLNPADFRRKV